jgi:hypothetical protein
MADTIKNRIDHFIKYVDVPVTNNTYANVYKGSGYIVTKDNIINAYCPGTDFIVAEIYFYDNIPYVALKGKDSLQTVNPGNYTIRCCYYS